MASSRIALRQAYRPEVLGVDTPTSPVAALVDDQRARRKKCSRAADR